nr:hypothetical protein [Comamonas testosteroni]
MNLSPIHLAAIRYFAAQHGKFWRRRLGAMWWSGRDATLPNGALLRQIRNEHGPAWLATFVLTREASLDASDQAQAKQIVELVARKLDATLTQWEQKAAKEWVYTTFSIGQCSVRVGASTGGAISINGSPHTVDGRRVIANNHLFELTLLEKIEPSSVA